MEDRRRKLGLQGRLELVMLIENGSTLRAAAAALSVAPATAHRWWHRWRTATVAERASRSCLRTSSTRPRSCPWGLSVEAEQAILAAREKTNWGPMQLQFLTGRHRSTIWKVLKRHGVSRQRRSERPQTTRRYEWTEAGALLHIDAFELPKFDRPGHWAHGDRSEPHKTRGAGKIKVIGVIDDHTRLVYCEIHRAENAITVSATLRRAAAWMREQGCGPAQAVMSDNAKCYSTSHEFRDTLAELGARHIRHPAPHPALEREDRAVLRHPRSRMGAPAHLAQQPPARPRPVIVHPLLQPPPTALGLRRPDHPSPAFTISAAAED